MRNARDGDAMTPDQFAESIFAKLREYVDHAVTKAIASVPSGAAGPSGPAGSAGNPGERGPEGVPGRDGRDALPMPGPAGERGEKGIDGRDGKDGRDGITEDRAKTLVAELRAELRAEIVKSIKLEGRKLIVDGEVLGVLAVPLYRGVHTAGTQYEPGDLVTFGGSMFHCNRATTEKPETTADWTLATKRGRDGKDRP